MVVQRRPRGEPEAPPQRSLRLLTWGLVPSWAKDRTVGSRMINARAETLLDKPAYRRAALSRRCLVPADGWYEWQKSPTATDEKGKPRKQPFFTRSADGDRLAFAGVFEFWRDDARPDDDPLAWLTTYAIVTTAAEPGLDRLHDRMPFVLPRERWDAWLDPDVGDAEQVRALLDPLPPGRFETYPVSRRVGDVRDAGPSCSTRPRSPSCGGCWTRPPVSSSAGSPLWTGPVEPSRRDSRPAPERHAPGMHPVGHAFT